MAGTFLRNVRWGTDDWNLESSDSGKRVGHVIGNPEGLDSWHRSHCPSRTFWRNVPAIKKGIGMTPFMAFLTEDPAHSKNARLTFPGLL